LHHGEAEAPLLRRRDVGDEGVQAHREGEMATR
jgi:hypothetical protein